MINYFSNQNFFLQNREDNHTFLMEWHFVPQLRNTWLFVKNSLWFCFSYFSVVPPADYIYYRFYYKDCAKSYLLHTCVSRCGAVTVSQCGLSGWESIGSTLQQDTDKPALQIHAHNTSDKPEGKKKTLGFIYNKILLHVAQHKKTV